MKRGSQRRRPAVHITLGRASRLHRFVMFLAESPRTRPAILEAMEIGLRTFYRELELLRRIGVKIRLVGKEYTLQTSAAEAEGLLPFPDPQLSFAEMAELAHCDCEAGRRLAGLLASVIDPESSLPRRKPKSGRKMTPKRSKRTKKTD